MVISPALIKLQRDIISLFSSQSHEVPKRDELPVTHKQVEEGTWRGEGERGLGERRIEEERNDEGKKRVRKCERMIRGWEEQER